MRSFWLHAEGYLAIMAIGLLLLPVDARAEARPAVADAELFRMEDRYRAGNYLAFGGLLAEVIAALSHDRGLAYGFYGASALMRYAGMPILAGSASDICRAGAGGTCASHGYAYFALSAAAEAALAAELFALEWDRRHEGPPSLSHLAGAYAAAGVSTAAFLFAWSRFREVRGRNSGEERMSFRIAPRIGGAGLTLRFAFGGDG
jgi:hypothetical protein